MRLYQVNLRDEKGWYFGFWDSSLPISVGFANKGVDEPHLHAQVAEVYFVARGTARIRVEQQTVSVSAGDVVVVEPGEAHTFLDSSPDYHHLVIQVPEQPQEGGVSDKLSVPRSRLGL